MILIVLFFSWFLLIINNFIIWWCIFIIFTMVGLLKLKLNSSSINSIFYYFLIQEMLGLLFMMNFSSFFQLFIFFMKGGFAPFHFWMVKVLHISSWFSFSWMLTIQKMPYYFIVMMFWNWSWFLWVLMGSLVPLLQSLLVKSVWYQIFLLLTSSGNNMLMLIWFEPLMCVYTLPFYLIFMNYMMNGLSNQGLIGITYEFIFLLMSFPGGLPFYIKLFSLSLLFNMGGLIVVLFLLSLVLNLISGFNLVMYVHSFCLLYNKLFIIFFFFFLVLLLL
uniref:NADH dehydrogenase subunit 2 n=1 Tax=Acrobeloides varius TaxID=2020968 RepID=A0A6M4B0C7_9BILA|nr:NADH dehydrogenase subunit 2 [Acrobeloides varius]